MRNSFWCFICFGILFSSCDSNRVFDEYKSVPNSWNKNEVISFNYQTTDSVQPHNLFVNIRNNNNYKYSNLFLLVELNYPNGKSTKDTLEYLMAKPNGELLGSGFSDVKENKLWFKENFVFSETGNYQINIQHAMRANGIVKGVENLEGITDIGFRVEHINSSD